MALKTKAKSKSIFRCQECGYSSQKWMGKCPDCNKWNSLVEEIVAPEPAARRMGLTEFSSAVNLLSEVSTAPFQRVRTGIGEFDRMIGGGVVPASLILLGGPPGIGKSTLMLQLASRLAESKKVLYVSGEESQEQIKARADRLNLSASNLFLVSETNLENILEAVRKVSPEFLIIDSIQTTYRNDLASAPGSVAQVRECAAEFLRCAKSNGITVFVLGHVTKEGSLAGPRVLEHIVDTVLYFETDKQQLYRILRSFKNRFGPTSEIAVFEMGSKGLVEISNPSEIFLTEHRLAPGSVLISTLEGSRPIILEVQSLTSKSHFGFPKRMVTGFDLNRILLLIAVLEKRLGLALQEQDIFVNLTGGLKSRESSADLGIACAIVSAFGNFSPNSEGVIIGEVGLGGEVRRVVNLAERVKEAERLGLSWAIVPKMREKEKLNFNKLKTVEVENIKQAVDFLRSQR